MTSFACGSLRAASPLARSARGGPRLAARRSTSHLAPRGICESRELDDTGFLLEPGRFALGRTIEHVALPLGGGLAARVEGRSSNLGPIPMTLTPALPICQLVLERVEGAVLESPSQFHGQSSASGLRKM